MSAFFSGVTVTELESTVRYDPRTGKTVIRHWKGDPDSIGFIEIEARRLGYRYQTNWDGGYLVVSVDYPEDSEGNASTPLSDEWEVDRNYFQKDIWTLPHIQTELAKIGPPNNPTVRGFFRNDLENLARGNPNSLDQEGGDVTVTLEVLLGSAFVGQSGAEAITGVAELYGADCQVFLDLFEALTRGVTSYEVTRCILRRTLVTNKTSTITSSRTNVERPYAVATINALLPEEVKFEAPTTGYYIKKEPEVKLIEHGKWEIVQEFWHADEYETLIYGAVVT